MSEKYRLKTLEWFSNTFVSRLNDKKNGIIIIVMQRLHQNDLTGYLLDKNKEDWISSRGCLIEATYATCYNIDMYNYEYTIKAAMNIKMNETNEKVEEFITFLKENDKETYYKLIASKEKVEGENNEEA